MSYLKQQGLIQNSSYEKYDVRINPDFKLTLSGVFSYNILLTYAGAKIKLNKIDATVINAINLVRARAGQPAAGALSQAALRQLVRRERAVEFGGEGQRRQTHLHPRPDAQQHRQAQTVAHPAGRTGQG